MSGRRGSGGIRKWLRGGVLAAAAAIAVTLAGAGAQAAPGYGEAAAVANDGGVEIELPDGQTVRVRAEAVFLDADGDPKRINLLANSVRSDADLSRAAGLIRDQIQSAVDRADDSEAALQILRNGYRNITSSPLAGVLEDYVPAGLGTYGPDGNYLIDGDFNIVGNDLDGGALSQRNLAAENALVRQNAPPPPGVDDESLPISSPDGLVGGVTTPGNITVADGAADGRTGGAGGTGSAAGGPGSSGDTVSGPSNPTGSSSGGSLGMDGQRPITDLLTGAGERGLATNIATRIFADCWACEFVGTFTQIADAFARKSFLFLSVNVVGIATLIFALWIAFQASKLFLPDFTESPGQIIKTLVVRSMIFFIIGMLALGYRDGSGGVAPASASFVFDYGPRLVLSEAGTLGAGLMESFGVSHASSDQVGSCGEFQGLAPGFAETPGLAAFDTDKIKSITCQIESMQLLASVGIVLATSMIEQAPDSIWEMGTLLFAIIAALPLLFVFGVLMLAFPFYYLDVIFQTHLILALAPVLLLMLLFKSTMGNFFSAVKTVFASGITLFAMSIIFSFGKTMMDAGARFGFDERTGQPIGGIVDLILAVQTGNFRVPDGNYDLSSGAPQNIQFAQDNIFDFTLASYWYILAGGVLILMLLKKTASIVNGLFGGAGNTAMGEGAQGMAKTIMGTAMGTGFKVAGLGALLTGFGLTKAAGPALRGTGAGLKAGVSKVRDMMSFRGGPGW